MVEDLVGNLFSEGEYSESETENDLNISGENLEGETENGLNVDEENSENEDDWNVERVNELFDEEENLEDVGNPNRVFFTGRLFHGS